LQFVYCIEMINLKLLHYYSIIVIIIIIYRSIYNSNSFNLAFSEDVLRVTNPMDFFLSQFPTNPHQTPFRSWNSVNINEQSLSPITV